MIVLGLLWALASPSCAQAASVPPEAPAPAAAVTPENLDDMFRRFASGRPMIPTLKEVQADRPRANFPAVPVADDTALPATRSDFARRDTPPLANDYRMTGEKVDVSMARPLPRLELGFGYSSNDAYLGDRHIEGYTNQYAFAHLDLSRAGAARKLVHSPTAVYTETELGEHTRVSNDDYSIRSLAKP